MAGVRSRWARLAESLKRPEPHTPINFEASLYQAPKYLELGKQVEPEWVPTHYEIYNAHVAFI
jgi:hypothetical protein